MALINKTGISNGGTIQAEHITRAIDALSGGSTDSVSITGSLMGSSSYAVTASYALNGGGGASESASYAATASTLIVSNDTSATGPRAILLATGLGATKAVASDSSDFAFNPIANTLTVAKISGNATSTSASVDMTASAAQAAATASIAFRMRTNGSIGSTPDGTFYVDESNPGTTANLYIIVGGTAYRFESTEAL